MAAFLAPPLGPDHQVTRSRWTTRVRFCTISCALRSFRLRDAKTLCLELERIASRPGSMPTYAQLVAAQRGDLSYALRTYHGGLRAFARQNGLSFATTTGGNSQSRIGVEARSILLESELHTELLRFIEDRVEKRKLTGAEKQLGLRVMPRIADLQNARRTDLLRAMRACGGSRAVALKMGLLMSANAVTDYRSDFDKLTCEIRDFMATYMPGSKLFPTSHHFRAGARLDIIAGIKKHGGTARVADTMKLKLQRGPRVRTRDESISWLQENFAATVSYLPTNQELLRDGRIDVLRHIFACGGREEVAKLLSLPLSDGTVFSEDLFCCDVCTSATALDFNSEESRRKEEPRGGGGGAILLAEGGRRRSAHYFLDFNVLKSELDAFIFDFGQVGIMPTAQQLIKGRRRDLVRAMQLHGGQKFVADRLGLVRQSLSSKQVKELTSSPVQRLIQYRSRTKDWKAQPWKTRACAPLSRTSVRSEISETVVNFT